MLTQAQASPPSFWSRTLRALREARGVTQDGWAVQLGVSTRTVQRWERGVAAPDASIEAVLLGHCEAHGLLRSYTHGPLAGCAVTRAWLSDLFAEARLQCAVGETGAGVDVSPPPPRRARPSFGPLTGLIARDTEVAAIVEHLRTTRLLTLTGPGGTGKTRLAQAVADHLAGEWPDGVVFVSLEAITDSALVLPTIARVLGIAEGGAVSAPASLTAALREQALLLVLDNVEQVLDAAADLVELLHACPRLTMLVTSRAPLRVRGERVLPVRPLAVPEPQDLQRFETLAANPSVRLFCDRGREVQSDFVLTVDNAATVAELCRRLDGLPLALELAAAQLRLFTPHSLLTRLDRRLALLVSGPRDLPARQRTLYDTIAWSYDLLTGPERVLFRHLAVFAGGCTIAAAEVVCETAFGSDVAAVTSIASLVEQSLLQRDADRVDQPRVRMLQSVRQFGWEQLRINGELEAVRREHAAHYLALAEEAARHVAGAARRLWHDRLEAEQDNLRAALAWSASANDLETELRLATTLFWFWALRGHWTEGRARLESAIEHQAEHRVALASPATAALLNQLRARALWCSGGLAWYQGNMAAAHVRLDQSIAVARDLGDRPALAQTTEFLGLTALYQGDHTAAASFLETSVSLFRAIGDEWNLADVLFILGDVLLPTDRRRAEHLYAESLVLYRAMDDPLAAQPLTSLGHLALQRGDFAAARVLLTEGLALRQPEPDRQQLAMALASLGDVARCERTLEQARELFMGALALARELGSKPTVAWALCSLGQIALAQGDRQQAGILLIESLRIAQELMQKQRIAACLVGLAGLASDEHRHGAATQLLGVAQALCDAIGMPLEHPDQIDFDSYMTAVGSALGTHAFRVAWEAGQMLPWEDAVGRVLSTVTS